MHVLVLFCACESFVCSFTTSQVCTRLQIRKGRRPSLRNPLHVSRAVSCQRPGWLTRSPRECFACAEVDYVHIFRAHAEGLHRIASRVHVLAVHPDRPLCRSPIVSPPRTLVPWNNANNHHHPPLHHCSRCERNERALSLRRYTQTHSPVCQTAWQKPYNYPITC